MLQAIKCFFGLHDYKLLGLIDKDKVYACRQCGLRHTEFFTLRIDRIGFLEGRRR
jgi:hypothetical protein